MKLSRKKDTKELIFSLLERFHYLNGDTLYFLLNEIADSIIGCGFAIETTQLLSITYDDEADSSQKILDLIKMPLFKKGWRSLKTVNHYRSSVKNYKQGKTQIITIDEFIGSGKTISGRIKQLRSDIPGDFDLKCYFIAGVSDAINFIRGQNIDIVCPLILEKGISGFYTDNSLDKAINLMTELESKLSQIINKKNLLDYSFGYGKAEALYSLEGCGGNTPNSTFPIFWWPKTEEEKERRTLLTRCESGF